MRCATAAVLASLLCSGLWVSGHVDGMGICEGRPLCARRAPRWISTGPSHSGDIGGDGPSPAGSDQEDGRAGDIAHGSRGGASSSGADNSVEAGRETLLSDDVVPEKRNTSPVIDLSPARPTARARTIPESDLQGGAGTPAGGGGGGGRGQWLGSSIDASETPRSRRASSRTTTAVSRVISGRGRKPLCGLNRCGSVTGTLVSKGGDAIPPALCAACHREHAEGTPWAHLGESFIGIAQEYFDECLQGNELLPGKVVESFSPSTMCLCHRNDCFFMAIRRYKKARSKKCCVVCGSKTSAHWRSGGASAGLYQIYFDGAGKSRAESYMAKTNVGVETDSSICNVCHMAYYRHVTSGKELPCSKHLHELSSRLPMCKGIRQVKQSVARKVYSSIASGEFVCNEDVQEWLDRERHEQGIHAVNPRWTRAAAQSMLRDIGEGVGDASLHYLDGASLGEDRRRRHVYLVPTVSRERHILIMDQDIRRLERDNEELRRRLEVASCGDGTSGTAECKTPERLEEREQAVRIAARVVKEDINGTANLRNVRRGTSKADDIARELEPIPEYLQRVPESLRLLLAGAFGLDMAYDREDDVDYRTFFPTSPRANARDQNVRKNHENKSYFMATLCLKAVLGDDYRAPHEMMLSQAMKSFGTSRSVIDFCAMLGLCLSDRQRYDREEEVVNNRHDRNLISPDISVAAVAWDNNDMKPTMNLVGQDYVSLCAATSVGVQGDEFNLSPESEWKETKDLTVKMVTEGSDRDDDINSFSAWREVLSKSVYACYASNNSLPGVEARETCVEAEVRERLSPPPRPEQETCHLFIQEASTKRFLDCKAVVDRIASILRIGEPGGRTRAVVAGDEETFRFMYRLKQCEPILYSWLLLYPGDWHILYHLAKAMLKRYWGAGIEYIAKELESDDNKAGEGSNYRRAHHHLTVMYEALMTEVIIKYYADHPNVVRVPEDMDIRIPEWIQQQADKHKTFKLWAQFLLEDYLAYLAFRAALRTGDFKLRLAALRRIAPIFCGYGKDRYQWLVSVHLADVARMKDCDMKALSALFATSLGGDAYALVGLDERQEVANRLYKGAAFKITRPYIRKVAAIVSSRERAVREIQTEFFVSGSSRDPVQELLGKRCDAVRTARQDLVWEKAFGVRSRKDILTALDGREAGLKEMEDILNVPQLCAAKFVDVVKSAVFKDKKASGPSKKRLKFFEAARKSNTASKKDRTASAVYRNLKNFGEGARELHAALRTLVEDYGSLSKEEVEKRVLAIGSLLPLALANITGGVNKANKAAAPKKVVERMCPGAFKHELTHAVEGHVVDGTAELHRAPGSETLAEGGVGFVQAHAGRFRSDYIRRGEDGSVETRLVVWCYDHAIYVEPIKAWTQSGRTAKTAKYDEALDVKSRTSLPAGAGFQAVLRARDNREVAARAIRDKVLGDPRPVNGNATVMFCGVGDKERVVSSSGNSGGDERLTPDITTSTSTSIPPPDRSSPTAVPASVRDEPASMQIPSNGVLQGDNGVSSAKVKSARNESGGASTSFLRARGPMARTNDELSDLYPCIGEGEMSTIHFIVNYRRYCKPGAREIKKWLVTSVDTDQWMIVLLAMGTGAIRANEVEVTVQRHVGQTEYLHVNRVSNAIVQLSAEGKYAGWPSPLPPWLDEGAKCILFVLVFVMSGCDFLPAITRCPFPLMWESLLRGLGMDRFLGEIVKRDSTGVARINTTEAIKIIALTYFFRDREAFPDDWKPSVVLHDKLGGSVEKFVNVIRTQVFHHHGNDGKLLCPSMFSLGMQAARADATLEYWQGAFAEKMPNITFKGRGWDTVSGEGAFTKSSMVVVLSSHCNVDSTGKVHKLICGCNPEKAEQRRCRGNCKCWKRGQKDCFPDACGCKGRCGRVPVAPGEPARQGTLASNAAHNTQAGSMALAAETDDEPGSHGVDDDTGSTIVDMVDSAEDDEGSEVDLHDNFDAEESDGSLGDFFADNL